MNVKLDFKNLFLKEKGRINMWLETGDEIKVWYNLDHIVRVEFSPGQKTAVVYSVKPGGSDKSIISGDDVQILLQCLQEKSYSSGK